MSKGSTRRDGVGYRAGYDRAFGPEPIECPACGEIELRHENGDAWECAHCRTLATFTEDTT